MMNKAEAWCWEDPSVPTVEQQETRDTADEYNRLVNTIYESISGLKYEHDPEEIANVLEHIADRVRRHDIN